MERRWLVIVNNYAGLEKRGADMVYGDITEYFSYVLPVKREIDVTAKELAENNIIVIGEAKSPIICEYIIKGLLTVPADSQGYSIHVGESLYSREGQSVVIAGRREAGVLNGCADFCARYLCDVMWRGKDIWARRTMEEPFSLRLNHWSVSEEPAIRERAVWTWGHVIYDYRGFFENMARLRLNSVVIWNDVAPINAREVVEYAHSLGIKVIWGFSWGWGLKCGEILEGYGSAALAKIKANVIDTYEREYKNTGCDGIYFQSFTELSSQSVGGVCVAEAVTELVNDISGELLEKYPGLNLQFGLHATSVTDNLEFIKKVDSRVRIVWENLGAFPYSYHTDDISEYGKTLELTEKLLSLRGEDERFGAVLKGMLKLDWSEFEHFSAPYILGERSARFIAERTAKKERLWKIQTAGWIKNAEYVRKTVEAIAESGRGAVVQGLIEDAMLESKISLPAAAYAGILWNPNQKAEEIISSAAKFSHTEL